VVLLVVRVDREVLARGLEWLLERGGRCIRRVRSRRELVVDLEVRDSLRDLGLEPVVLGLGIVREQVLELGCCLRRKRLHRLVRLVLDSVVVERRGMRRTRKLRSRDMLRVLERHRFRWVMFLSPRRSLSPRVFR